MGRDGPASQRAAVAREGSLPPTSLPAVPPSNSPPLLIGRGRGASIRSSAGNTGSTPYYKFYTIYLSTTPPVLGRGLHIYTTCANFRRQVGITFRAKSVADFPLNRTADLYLCTTLWLFPKSISLTFGVRHRPTAPRPEQASVSSNPAEHRGRLRLQRPLGRQGRKLNTPSPLPECVSPNPVLFSHYYNCGRGGKHGRLRSLPSLSSFPCRLSGRLFTAAA